MELWKIESTGEINTDAINSMKAWRAWLNAMCDDAFDNLDYLDQEIPLYSLMCDMRANIERLADACDDAIAFVAGFHGIQSGPMDNPRAAENAKDCLKRLSEALESVGRKGIRPQFFGSHKKTQEQMTDG